MPFDEIRGHSRQVRILKSMLASGQVPHAFLFSGIEGIGKRDLRLNAATPAIRVDPETYTVTADGVELRCEPARELPLAQRYFLF